MLGGNIFGIKKYFEQKYVIILFTVFVIGFFLNVRAIW